MTGLFRNTLLVLCAAFALTGCLMSAQPIFSDATAVPVLGDGGNFRAYETNGTRAELFVVTRKGNSYEFVDPKGTVSPTGFYLISGDRYIAQVRDRPDRWVYVPVRIKGTTVQLYSDKCPDQDKTRLVALGAEPSDDQDCKIDNVHDTQALMATFKFVKRAGKLVRETKPRG